MSKNAVQRYQNRMFLALGTNVTYKYYYLLDTILVFVVSGYNYMHVGDIKRS